MGELKKKSRIIVRRLRYVVLLEPNSIEGPKCTQALSCIGKNDSEEGVKNSVIVV